MIHPGAPPSILGRGVNHFVEGHIMKPVAEPFGVVSILSEVEPGDGVLILKGDLESENLRVEADRTLQIRHVQIDVGDVKRLDHLRRRAVRSAAAMRSGVNGWRPAATPSGARASATALESAAEAPITPPSAMPFMPRGALGSSRSQGLDP